MKLACAYARRSTDDQAGSLPAQWEQIEAFAKRDGYQIIERFEDDGVSGTSLDRPGLNALIASAADGAPWRYLLVWDRSRLGRPEDPREAIAVTYQIERNGCTIVPLQGTRQTGDTTIDTILEALEFGEAGKESIRRSRDVLRGQVASAQKGNRPCGKVPFGYDALYVHDGTPTKRIRHLPDGTRQILSVDGKRVVSLVTKGKRIGKNDDETVVPVPGDRRHVRTVQGIFRDFLTGLSTRVIARSLNQHGILTPKGSTWSHTNVVRILTNPAYKGVLAWNRYSTAKFHALKENSQVERVSNPRKRWSVNAQDDWIVAEHCWEGLVNARDWDSANAKIAKARPPACRGKGATSPYLVSGLLHCLCGSPCYGKTRSSSAKQKYRYHYEYYACSHMSERGRSVCDSKLVRREVVDDYLERRICELYFEPAAKASLWQEIEHRLDEALSQMNRQRKKPIESQQQRLSEIEAETRRLVAAVGAGLFSNEEAASRLVPLRQEKAKIAARLELGDTAPPPLGTPRLRRKVLVACRDQIREEADLWPGASPVQRKQIIRAHVASLVADGARSTLRAEFYPLIHLTKVTGVSDTSRTHKPLQTSPLCCIREHSVGCCGPA